MKVALLSPYPGRLSRILSEDQVVTCVSSEDQIPDGDILVSFGFKRIISPEVLGRFERGGVNIHIGFLPWNRGADPNFWSFFDNTKKGVTIHHINEGIDTGDIVFQAEIAKYQFDRPTLKTTYDQLMDTAVRMFGWCWPSIKHGRYTAIKQGIGGSYHKRADKNPWVGKLRLGWDTPVAAVEALGREHRDGKHGPTVSSLP